MSHRSAGVRSKGVRTMPDVASVKDRVQKFLMSEVPVRIDDDGDFVVQAGSTVAFVQVFEHSNGKATLVNILAPVLLDVPLSADLYQHVAVHADDYVFGHLSLDINPDGATGRIMMRHTLLGDYLDKDELLYATMGLAGVADTLDDELKASFGGRRLSD
jgi:hypothetical protein